MWLCCVIALSKLTYVHSAIVYDILVASETSATQALPVGHELLLGLEDPMY